jgi:hypothetical protein
VRFHCAQRLPDAVLVSCEFRTRNESRIGQPSRFVEAWEAGGVTGEEYLRQWAAEIVAAGDLDWWSPFSSIVTALDLIDAIDIEVARQIGQGIRAGLTARTGQPVSDFFLGVRRRHPSPRRGFSIPPPTAAPVVAVRAASAQLPAAIGDGATHFLVVENGEAFLTSSGPGPAPWPNPDDGAPSPPFLGVDAVIDDCGEPYHLTFRASAAPALGEPRQRWSLTTGIVPAPSDHVNRLELLTAHGPIRLDLRPPVPTSLTYSAFQPTPTPTEVHLTSSLYRQVWLHLLDPQRPSTPCGLSSTPSQQSKPSTPRIPSCKPRSPWTPPSQAIPQPSRFLTQSPQRFTPRRPQHGTGSTHSASPLNRRSFPALEAIVGHRDRFEIYFTQPPLPLPPGPGTIAAHDLVVWATDDLGGGYVGHEESAGHGGLYHLRPPLDASATSLAFHLQGPIRQAIVDIDLLS